MSEKKTLKEAILEDPEKGESYWNVLVAKAEKNPFFRKIAKEAKMDSGEALGYIYEKVIEGAQPYLSREFSFVVHGDKPSVGVGLGTETTAGDMTAGAFPKNNLATNIVTITANQIKGLNTCWTREYIEDTVWEVMARQAAGAGRAVEKAVMDYLITVLAAIPIADQAGGAEYAITTTGFTWSEFAGLIARVETADFHPDIMLVTPKMYAQLLELDQFVNSLYAGSDEVMRSGIAKTTFGVTIIRSSRVTTDKVYVLESSKALGLYIRADITVEPYERPETNEYGFVARIRFGAMALHKTAFCTGEATGTGSP